MNKEDSNSKIEICKGCKFTYKIDEIRDIAKLGSKEKKYKRKEN